MNRRMIRRITLWTSFGLIVLGCSSPLLATPPPASASVPLGTVVAETAAAAQTQTAMVITPSSTPTVPPTATKTATVTPSPTATILFITETNVPDSLLETGGYEEENNGSAIGIASGTPSSSKKRIREWACRITYRSPANEIVIARETTFQVKWTVQNTGTKTWPKKGVDVVYASGADLHIGKPYIDIPATVGPGGKTTVTITLVAPKRAGDYSTRWSLKVGRTEFCGLKFTFTSQ